MSSPWPPRATKDAAGCAARCRRRRHRQPRTRRRRVRLRRPQPVPEPLAVPAEPVRDDAIASASLDDLNRNSPLKPVFFELDSSDISAGRTEGRSTTTRRC